MRDVARRALIGLIVAAAVIAWPTSASATDQPGRAGGMTWCIDESWEDLRAQSVSCQIARAVWRRRDARLRLNSRLWTCRAFNGRYYTWRCSAAGNRLVIYRWKSGE